MGDAGSKEKKPTHCGWAQEASQNRWPWVGCIGDIQEEGGGSSVPKEQQVKRPRGRGAGGRRAIDGCGGPERCIPRQEMGGEGPASAPGAR